MANPVWTGATDNSWSTTTNWSTGAVPVTGDNVTLSGTVPITSGLSQSGVTLASLIVLPNGVTCGTLTTPLAISASLVICPAPTGNQISQGITRLNLNLGSNAAEVVVQSTGTSLDSGLDPVRITGSNASNALTVSGGIVGLGTNLTTDTPTFPTITVTGGQLTCGIGLVDNGALTLTGGTVIANNRPASGAMWTTVTINGQTNSTPILDCSKSAATGTITNRNQYNGVFKWAYPGQITITNDNAGSFYQRTVSSM